MLLTRQSRIHLQNTHNAHVFAKVYTGRRQILTEEEAMRREESVPDELVNVHVNDTSDIRLWTP